MLSWGGVFLLLRVLFLISLFLPLRLFALKTRSSSSELAALPMKSSLTRISWHSFVLDLEEVGERQETFGCKISFSRITCADPTLVFCALYSPAEVTETRIENIPPDLQFWHPWILLEVNWGLEGNEIQAKGEQCRQGREGKADFGCVVLQ